MEKRFSVYITVADFIEVDASSKSEAEERAREIFFASARLYDVEAEAQECSS